MTKEEEEAFAFYENTMYGDSEISEEEDLDDFTFPEDEADDIEKETETEGHFNWHCEKVGELFGATYFKVCPGWTGKGLGFPTGLPSMVKKERGKLTTLNHIREALAKKHGANFTCLPTSFNAMCMLVRAAIQRQKDITPYWRVLKRGGELNKEYPGGIYLQRERLEEEGFEIVEKIYSSRYFVKDYKKYLAEL